MRQTKLRLALVFGWLMVGLPSSAVVAQTQQPAACTGSAYRQFDFWIGSWEVTNPQGTVVGTNTIRRILGGCVLHESWRGASGSTGQSFNIYNLQTDTWHQSWVDNSGQLLLLDGGLDERGRMRLRGETVGQDGGAVHHEITWEQVEGGQVRQVWRTSTDGGTSWRVVFDGLYTNLGRREEGGGRDWSSSPAADEGRLRAASSLLPPPTSLDPAPSPLLAPRGVYWISATR